MVSRVVAVSGGFDPLHAGHIALLAEASRLGDWLVVILNSDRWLIEKKGICFMDFAHRRQILQSIRYVDEVLGQVDGDDSVCQTLEAICPHYFVNGGDRTSKEIPEAATCRKLGIDMIDNIGGKKTYSSSALLARYADNLYTPKLVR